jgi:SAM-dependent methyltransferase
MQTVEISRAKAVPSAGAPQPTPARIFDTLLFSHARADALKAALDLELFTAIAEGWRTAEPLAKRCQASERGICTLCDFLVVDGFLTKSSGDPLYFGSVAQFIAARHNAEHSATILESVRTGRAVSDISDEVDKWVNFAQAMVPMVALVAGATAGILDVENAGPIRVLDVAAGHGEFGLAIARKNQHAHIVGLDFLEVVAVARRRAHEAGFGDRYATLEGSAFDLDLGGPYDIVLLPNFLHHFRAEKIERFLKKVAAAVKTGGRVATVEFVPNDDRVSPPAPAMFSMTMLTNADGDAYTLAELDGMLRRAGFAKSRAYLAPPTPRTIIVSKRA